MRLAVASASGDDGLCGPPPPPWSPTHLEVALLGARGLRTKGGSASSSSSSSSFLGEVELGAQRVRLAPPSSSSSPPKWATLELPPSDPWHQPQEPPMELRVTLWQQKSSLLGPERFLGALRLPLGPPHILPQAGPTAPQTRWYKLHSKPGKKEKDRGEVQLSLRFTRQSLTASMFDLSAKEKPRSPFGRLKDKMKGRQKYDLESASAIVPGSCAVLEDDLGLAEAKKGLRLGKGGFFFKGKLRRSSLTRSNTSLGSDSTLSSAGSLGAIAGMEALTPSPSRHSSLSTDRSVRDFLPSPKLTHKRAFSDEVSQVNLLPESKSVQSLKPSGKEPISRSSLCINGSHIYCEEPSPKPSSPAPAPLPPPLPPQSLPDKPEEGRAVGPRAPEPELPPWSSSSSSSRGQKGPPKDPPRFIPSPPILAAQEEDKLSVKTIALNKHRGRAKKEEALRAESRPVQIAAPLVFSSEVVRVRPHERTPKGEEGQEEGGEQEAKKKKARSGFFRRRSSSKDSGTGHATVIAESVAPLDAPSQAGGEERGRSSSASGWFGRHDSKERKPSSHPGLLAAAKEFPRDPPPFPEDHGPPSFGEPPPESPTQRTSIPEPPAIAAAAITPPSEWDESFDAFATSRLRPASGMENPLEVAQADALDRTGPPETGAGSLLPRGSESRGSEGGEPYPGGPDLLNFVPEERNPLGSRSVREPAEDGSSGATLPWGPSSEEGSDPRNLARPSAESWAREEERRREIEGGPASPGGEEWWETAQGTSVGTPVPDMESNIGSQHPIPAAPGLSSLSSAIVFSGEEDRLPVSPTDGEPTGTPSLAGGSSQGPDVEMWETPVADVCHAELEREEETPVPKAEAVMEAAWFSEEDNLNSGLDMEEEEEGKVAVGIQRDGGVGERHRAETPPPKPPRSFTPLSLQEEANDAAWGRKSWQDEVAPCGEASVLETEQQRPPTGEARPTGEVIMGPGGGVSVPHATESLQLASEPAGANDPRGQEVSSKDATPAAPEGPGGADRFETCPSALSVGGLTLLGAKEDASCLREGDGGQPDSSVGMTKASEPPGVPEPDSSEVTMETPGPREAGGQPCRTLSPSVFFWSALEEQRALPSQDRRPLALPEGRGHLDGEKEEKEEEEEVEDPLAFGPSKVGPVRSHVGQTLPVTVPYPEGRPSKGREGGSVSESDLSPRWSKDQVMDFKRADFWQADGEGQRGHNATAMTPGNPFAPQLSPQPPPLPSPQNNPFVERPPDVLPAQAAVLQVSPLDAPRDLLFPSAVAPEERAAPAPVLHGHQPLAFSTPSLQAALRPSDFSFPSPVGGPAAAQTSLALSQDSTQPLAPSVLPAETWQKEEEAPLQLDTSPHVVKPISSTPGPETAKGDEGEKPQRPAATLTPIRSGGQEKPESGSAVGSLEDGASLAPQPGKTEAKRDPSDRAAQYYHLTHEELVQLLQKREAELRKEKEHVRELENYIDRLLVRIMEQSPTLLQISLGREAKAAK